MGEQESSTQTCCVCGVDIVGRRSHAKTCSSLCFRIQHNRYNRAYKETNKVRLRAYAQKHLNEDRDRINAKTRALRQENIEAAHEKDRRYRRNMRLKYLASDDTEKKKQDEKNRAKKLRHRVRNRENIRKRTQLWYVENRAQICERRRRRRREIRNLLEAVSELGLA